MDAFGLTDIEAMTGLYGKIRCADERDVQCCEIDWCPLDKVLSYPLNCIIFGELLNG